MYECPKCGGRVEPVRVANTFRWTCRRCRRDYGYGTSKPTFEPDFRHLTTGEIAMYMRFLFDGEV